MKAEEQMKSEKQMKTERQKESEQQDLVSRQEEAEQKHFFGCRELIRENILAYEQKTEAGRRETEELYAAVSSGNVELYNNLVVSRDLQEHNERQLKKNRAAYVKPYFGRIDYQETESGARELLYVGKNGVSRDKTDVIIVDWRAPVSTLYYENELGYGSYEVPQVGEISVELKLKRTFDVNDGKLLGYYDNDTAATDELLVKYLSQNKDVILGDIISTIQKEQNEIIRQTPFQNVIVQGVAGSGKTTVAMHRISYILYNFEKRFLPHEFCIIGGNDMLLHYITSGLPELDVYHVGQKRMDLFFIDMLGKEWKKKYEIKDLEDGEAFKSRISFVKELESRLEGLRQEIFAGAEVRDPQLGVILSAESIKTTLQENRDISVCQIYRLLNDRIRTRIKFLCPEEQSHYCKEKLKEYRGYFKQKAWEKNIVKIYTDFLQIYGEKQGLYLDPLIRRCTEGKFDVYDTAALTLIQKRITEKSLNDEYGQIIIDESQDFGAMVYYVLRQALHQCYFTIMGDVSQNINYQSGMNQWDDLKTEVFEPERTRFHILAKSYRNTIEISEYAGHILEQASFGAYKIQPVIRHGREVEFHREPKDMLIQKTHELIQEIQGRNYVTIAVICRTTEEAERVKGELAGRLGLEETADFKKGVMVLPIQLTKGLEFDGVILFDPTSEAYGENEAEAKLLYVAVTRALHELHVIWENEKSLSPLLNWKK